MPLHKGAKPGSPEFGENIKAEITAGKPQKQAEAIAFSESGEHKGHVTSGLDHAMRKHANKEHPTGRK